MELRNPKQLSGTCDACDTGYISREGYTMSQFVALFLTVATLELSAFSRLRNLPYSTTDVSEVLFKPGGTSR